MEGNAQSSSSYSSRLWGPRRLPFEPLPPPHCHRYSSPHSGYLEALLNNDPNLHTTPQDYIYSLDEEFQSNRISVALGVVGLDLNAHGRINFSIEHVATSRVDSLKFQVVAKDGEWGWRKMRFNFLATTQDSLFQASSETVTQFSVGLEKGRYALYRALPNINNFNLEPIVRVFLSGVDLAALPLELDSEYQTMLQQYNAFKSFSTNIVLINYFEQAIEDKKSIQLSLSGAKILSRFLTFSITTNADLKLIRYSYILFSNQALIGKHHYILGDFELLNNVKHSITPLSNMGMLMTGLTSFHIPRSQSYQLNLAFDSYFGQGYFQAKTSHAFLPLNFTFLAMEMMQRFVCEDCPDNASIIYDNKYCVQACPRGFSISSRLENSYCDKCDVQKLKVVDPSTGNCVCARRHYWNQTEDTCKPCSYDCMTCSQENQCLSCDNPLMQTGRKINAQGRCSCPPTGFYDDKAAEDIVCHPCSSYCLTCSGPRSHDCLTCTTGKELDSQGHCVCSNHYVETRPGVCSCPAPRIIFKGFCVDPNETCGENQV